MTIPRVKTCLVTHEFPPSVGGVGVSVQRIAKLLHQQEFEVHVAVFDIVDQPVLLDDNTVTTMEEGVSVHRLTVSSHKSIGSLEMFESLKTLQRQHQFDVLNGFFLYPSGFMACMVGELSATKTMVSIRGNDIGKHLFDHSKYPYIVHCLKKADYITSVSSDLLDTANCLHPIREKSEVIHNSLTLTLPQDKYVSNLPIEGICIGVSGVFKYKKGLKYLFKALSRLKQEHAFTLLLIGDYKNESERQDHTKAIKEFGLEERAFLTGFMDRTKVLNTLSLVDIYVIPSLFSEGCPSALLEAMAMKTAIVGSRSGAIPEILTDRQNALLVESASSDPLYQSLHELFVNPALREQLAQNAHRSYLARSPKQEGQAWADAYQKVLQSQGYLEKKES